MFTGSDLLYFLAELWEDILNIQNADLFSVGFRLVLVIVGLIVVASLVKFFFRLFWDVFGGVFRWVWWMLSSPYRVPRQWIRKASARRRRKKQEKEWRKQEEERAQYHAQQEQTEAQRQQQEREDFEKIMNQSPDFSKFKK